ncbi:pimeloyl-ACP methyl ester carboxylesterase/heme/copper-type cytochrome/quinol oxidase subunit 4 [Chryseobacterium defluvii]|uniref:Proline iminopeptidase n=1 Tax=Chryseobacterium defluvii TaxID=160396 RepID=A0A840K558_9FLAO|nr:alpha/beta fold hydrolase [Chryseobacterium defluvii]MBB4804731.1 pimeloyl-ACP methyl ester carboxylesterase/heme/copper-type cytochrome/quinol oxidase subunit 4 [Chryseobacterium defluvii]
MRLFRFFFLITLFITVSLNAQTKLEKVKSYFPDSKELRKDPIEWYRFSVPENWEKVNERKISLAVAVLKSKTASKQEPVVFIQGGPGGNTVAETTFWVDHPLRKNHDIVLVDLRGTGFSEPRLCPDLGKKFFEILAKNQPEEQDVKDKVQVSLECRQDMINQGIDLGSYNSISVARDLHALKNALKIQKWNVYGVSYGTYISQNYAKIFPNDIHTLTLDSSISDISEYYTNNTQNYMLSLNKLFKSCKDDPKCNKEYPNLEKVYYNTIAELEKKPITVEVDHSVVPSGKFTYNAEDYKIAIQQSLYEKKLVEVLPLLIYQFKERNTAALAGLVQAFSGALSLNYGNYFCFTCNEVIPYNNLQKYDSISSKYKKLNGGLSFYRSDFNVCDQWNRNQVSSMPESPSLKNDNPFKVLILSGGFDPITPAYFADETSRNFNKNVQIVNGYTYGHGLGYTQSGANIIGNFMENKPITDSLKQYFNKKDIAFKTDITLNKGVVKMTGDMNSKQWYYFIPLIISLVVILVVFIGSLAIIFSKGTKSGAVVLLLFLTSLLILTFIISLGLGINTTLNDNLYLLAFGLPSKWSFAFLIYRASLLLSVIAFFVSLVKTFRSNIPLYVILFLAIGIVHYYFINWGEISF